MKKVTIKVLVYTIFLLSSSNVINAQDIKYVRMQLDKLCSPQFYGRAYYNKGDSIAADYISAEFKKQGIRSFGQNYFQRYSFGVNILENVSVKINGRELKFGRDYMMDPSSGSLTGVFKPLTVNTSLMRNPQKLLDSIEFQNNNTGKVIILDSTGLKNPELFRMVKTLGMRGKMGISGLIEVSPKIGIGLVGRKSLSGPHVQVDPKALPEIINEVALDIKNHYDPNYSTRNVIGYIPGQTDKFIVFTAHYDGIGSFGEGNYFPAAEDNGSGTTMVLDLARSYASGKKPYYSIAFMLFSGEEAGLLGSSYYVEHPLFPLAKIKLVINLDMIGTGQDGVILFNGKERPLETAIVQSINEQKHYMKSVDIVAGSANSDHYPFHHKNVPAIFFLTKGPSGGGHSPDDTLDKLPLYSYNNLFKLVIDLINELQNQELY